MSKYTTELRFICEHLAGLTESGDNSSIKDIIEKARTKIFDFDYPLFDESYKQVIESKFLRHFYTREISAESYGLWKLWLEDEITIKINYYNQLWKSALLEFDPFNDTDLKTDGTKENKGEKGGTDERATTSTKKDTGGNTITQKSSETNTGTVGYSDSANKTSTGKNTKRYSDTPQGGLNGIENNNYLTNVTIDDTSSNENTSDNSTTTNNLKNDSNTTTKNDNNSNSTFSENVKTTLGQNFTDTGKYFEHLYGKSSGKSMSEMLKEYRDTFINIDEMFIHEFDNLFINLW